MSASGIRFWTLRRCTMPLPPCGRIMGILNVTPDSFSDGGRYVHPQAALAQATRLLQEGADIIDIGGESTRPGALPTDAAVELRRVLPVVELIRREYPQAVLSVDTRHVSVARAALDAGVDIVNDVEGLADEEMRRVCAEYGCGVVLMHSKGSPQTMQDNPQYGDVLREVRSYFERRVQSASAAGVRPECICLDPGIGFGKTTQHNVSLIEHLEQVRVRDLPLMMGLSRKRFLRELGRSTVEMSLVAARHGAQLHRVHEAAPLRAALDAVFQ